LRRNSLRYSKLGSSALQRILIRRSSNIQAQETPGTGQEPRREDEGAETRGTSSTIHQRSPRTGQRAPPPPAPGTGATPPHAPGAPGAKRPACARGVGLALFVGCAVAWGAWQSRHFDAADRSAEGDRGGSRADPAGAPSPGKGRDTMMASGQAPPSVSPVTAAGNAIFRCACGMEPRQTRLSISLGPCIGVCACPWRCLQPLSVPRP